MEDQITCQYPYCLFLDFIIVLLYQKRTLFWSILSNILLIASVKLKSILSI